MHRRLLISILTLLCVIVTLPASTAAIAKPSSGTPALIGNDVSWPQCHRTLPSMQHFGLVGVNGGLANTTNSCFAAELAWANASLGGTSQPKAALYVNTANPGNVGVADWPTSGTSVKYGTCTGADNQACAYQYGWTMAMLDATTRIGDNDPSAFTWWLDVETGNSWETNTLNNRADLEGMADYFTNIGAPVGLYSTSTQWKQIAGSAPSTSSLYGLNSWLPGASSYTAAKTNCSLPALTGGKVTLTQYVTRRVDYDVSCS